MEWVQTHLSHVYLTGERVYKFRKPVSFGFVDFSTRRERNADCLREVRLNRRLAPDVYLGVAALDVSTDPPRVGAPREELSKDADAVEHCVVMRRLPAGRDALSLLQAGELDGPMLDALAARIARFHADQKLGAPAPFSAQDWHARCTRPVDENFRSLAGHGEALVPRSLLASARDRAEAFASARAEAFEARRRQGRAVDGHGDLHLQHVWYERAGAEPIAIDGLEFSEALRRVDAASEVAFLAMDLRYRHAPGLAERFLRHYARDSDDFGLYTVVDYFLAYRAGVRAKVAALAAADPAIESAQRAAAGESVTRHLELAAAALESRPAPSLVLVSGVVGTGKSTVAAELAGRLDAVVIASDRVRKRLFGVAPTERLSEGWGRGAYSPEQSKRVYAGLLERARPVLESGRHAILDATFSRREQRCAAADLARASGARAFAVEVRCEPERARQRLAQRAARGGDPSDAGPEDLVRSLRGFEPWSDWPAETRAVLSTDEPDWPDRLTGVLERIGAKGAPHTTRAKRGEAPSSVPH